MVIRLEFITLLPDTLGPGGELGFASMSVHGRLFIQVLEADQLQGLNKGDGIDLLTSPHMISLCQASCVADHLWMRHLGTGPFRSLEAPTC